MNQARREGGLAEWIHPDGLQNARPTFTCCHCGNVTIVPLKARQEDCGGFCRLCMKPTCTACADGGCKPFERRLEENEARGRLMRSIGI